MIEKIDWSRTAEPQEDGYDLKVALEFAKSAYGYEKKVPAEGPTFLDGMIQLGHLNRQLAEYLHDAPFDHPHIAKAEEFIKKWPLGYEQAVNLLNEVYPIDDDRYAGAIVQGCSCGPGETFGMVYATVMDPVGFAEGILHEMGHWKLHAYGIHLEDWDNRLIANDPSELYVSPIRKDVKRPVGAVLQAQMSYIYVTELDVRVRSIPHILVNLPRIEEGRATLASCFRGTEEGEEFIKGFYAWCDRVIAEGRQILSDEGIPYPVEGGEAE